MKLLKLKLENFKGIKEQELNFDGKTTVIFGVNGTGKSTILHGINVICSRMIQKISGYKQSINLRKEDIRFGASRTEISLSIEFKGSEKIWYLNRGLGRNDNKLSKSQTLLLNEVSSYFADTYIDDDCANMPIFVNYGVHRVVLDIPLRIMKNHSFDKTSAFEKAVESKIDFRTFFEWFRNQEDYENEIKVTKNSDYKDVSLEAVRSAVYKMLKEFSDMRVKRSPLRMIVTKNNMTLEMNQLSDGEKCTIALIGDLARRLSLANPNLDNPLNGSGVALIDEIELHMHPTWQRRIIPSLKETFPNVQFIITTHSPQVLGEVDDSVNIFSINQEGNAFVADKLKGLIAWDTNLILEELMETDSLNRNTKRLVSKLFDLIDERDFQAASELADEIDDLSQGNNLDIIKG